MDLETNYLILLNSLDLHCRTPEIQLSSRSEDIKDSKSYKELSSLGSKVLPFIKDSYLSKHLSETTIYHAFPMLVGEIAGSKFKIPSEIAGRLESIRGYTINWLENMGY
jgi:hypothetical protein